MARVFKRCNRNLERSNQDAHDRFGLRLHVAEPCARYIHVPLHADKAAAIASYILLPTQLCSAEVVAECPMP